MDTLDWQDYFTLYDYIEYCNNVAELLTHVDKLLLAAQENRLMSRHAEYIVAEQDNFLAWLTYAVNFNFQLEYDKREITLLFALVATYYGPYEQYMHSEIIHNIMTVNLPGRNNISYPIYEDANKTDDIIANFTEIGNFLTWSFNYNLLKFFLQHSKYIYAIFHPMTCLRLFYDKGEAESAWLNYLYYAYIMERSVLQYIINSKKLLRISSLHTNYFEGSNIKLSNANSLSKYNEAIYKITTSTKFKRRIADMHSGRNFINYGSYVFYMASLKHDVGYAINLVESDMSAINYMYRQAVPLRRIVRSKRYNILPQNIQAKPWELLHMADHGQIYHVIKPEYIQFLPPYILEQVAKYGLGINKHMFKTWRYILQHIDHEPPGLTTIQSILLSAGVPERILRAFSYYDLLSTIYTRIVNSSPLVVLNELIGRGAYKYMPYITYNENLDLRTPKTLSFNHEYLINGINVQVDWALHMVKFLRDIVSAAQIIAIYQLPKYHYFYNSNKTLIITPWTNMSKSDFIRTVNNALADERYQFNSRLSLSKQEKYVLTMANYVGYQDEYKSLTRLEIAQKWNIALIYKSKNEMVAIIKQRAQGPYLHRPYYYNNSLTVAGDGYLLNEKDKYLHFTHIDAALDYIAAMGVSGYGKYIDILAISLIDAFDLYDNESAIYNIGKILMQL